jgi:CHAD domain-containing protein
MARPWSVPEFDPDESPRASAAKILRTKLLEMCSYEKPVLGGNETEAIHDMRVSARRFQAALKLFQGFFQKKKFRTRSRELKELVDLLGEVRHYDVLLASLPPFTGEVSQVEGEAVRLLTARLSHDRGKAFLKLRKEIRHRKREHYEEAWLKFLTRSLEL